MTSFAQQEADGAWLEAFRRGDREVLAACYRRYYRVVEAAIGRLLGTADRETVIHEVFFRLISEPEMRMSFNGPSLGPWLAAVARNRAVDLSRRAQRESLVAEPPEASEASGGWGMDEDAILRVLLERFGREQLPPEWVPLFEARYLRQMTQREAARHLGIRRTTLAYREMQIRRRLKKFMLEEEQP
jgi:RNA polymerase sigma-70 factor (ECF subfamily)